MLVLSAGVAFPAGAWAQAGVKPPAPSSPPAPAAPAPADQAAPDPDADGDLPAIPLKDGLKQLKRIRLKHFGQIRNVEIRQAGIAKLKDYGEYKFYPHLLEIFANEDKDVRGAVLNLLQDQKDERADTTIAYAAIFDKDAWFRQEAAQRLKKRMKQVREEAASKPAEEPELATPAPARSDAPKIPPGLDAGVPWRVKAVIVNGLKSKNDTVASAAANLAADLEVFDLIPAMVNAQVQQPTGTGASVGNAAGGSLAYIMVGQQEAFVADLEPVVGDSAVAFDPTLGVVTSGTVLSIGDAAVVTYRTEIYYALRRLADSGWDGRTTEKLGFNQRAWREWYADEFVPYRQAVANGDATEGEPLK
jgi:hypothetical protein